MRESEGLWLYERLFRSKSHGEHWALAEDDSQASVIILHKPAKCFLFCSRLWLLLLPFRPHARERPRLWLATANIRRFRHRHTRIFPPPRIVPSSWGYLRTYSLYRFRLERRGFPERPARIAIIMQRSNSMLFANFNQDFTCVFVPSLEPCI